MWQALEGGSAHYCRPCIVVLIDTGVPQGESPVTNLEWPEEEMGLRGRVREEIAD